MNRFEEFLPDSFWRIMASAAAMAVVVCVLIYLVFDHFSGQPSRQWCADHGYSAATFRGGAVCLDDQRRIVLPK